MRSPHLIAALAVATACLTTQSPAATAKESTPVTQDAIATESVVQFLIRFEEIAEKEDFSLLQDMIHERAFFRFNDGDFVGRPAVQAAFEKTWKSASGARKERFYLTNIVVLSTDHASASATYTYNWEGIQDGKQFRIQGRGTRVLVKEQGRLQIIHEHLSRYPKTP
jgi:ketosteroid isomerase-like protein